MSGKKEYKFKDTFEWKEFTSQFLNLSELACKKFESQFSEEDQQPSDFYIATVYNIKHAIEICVKTYIRYLDDEIDFRKELKHDTKKLLDYFNKKANVEKISNIINRLKDNEEYNFVKSKIKELEKIVEETESIVSKYYDLTELNDKINGHLIIAGDYNNTFFKYPENNLNCSFSYKGFLAEIDVADILKIKDDIDIMRINLFVLGEILYYYRKFKNQ